MFEEHFYTNQKAHSCKRNGRKQPENSLFLWSFKGIWTPPNGPKKVLNGRQVERMYSPMS
jgi:hypothetical protein